MKQRPKDKSKLGYVNWPFMSVHTWGEMSKGRWKLIVTDVVNLKKKKKKRTLKQIHQFYYIYVCCSLARIAAFCQGASLTPRQSCTALPLCQNTGRMAPGFMTMHSTSFFRLLPTRYVYSIQQQQGHLETPVQIDSTKSSTDE